MIIIQFNSGKIKTSILILICLFNLCSIQNLFSETIPNSEISQKEEEEEILEEEEDFLIVDIEAEDDIDS